ncbi:unnamed protein product [Phytophthora lilii]|uniref:Unnamed protein product n=1 Tax=Phytophthora lilii TaxID=2077276 RepID=A0A9W6TTP0_9STRA|nr:unnamed protein product [Phytophthora lilii]
MLPSLSDKLSSNLQFLVPVAVVPSHLSARRNALLELKKVDAVQVVCSGSRDRFVVEVCADSPISSIAEDEEEPVSQDDVRLRRPTIRITRTQLEFVRLRNRVYDIAHSAHRGEPCEFCSAILDLIVFGANPDGFLVGLLSSKRMAKKLSEFVKSLLRITTQHTCTDPRGSCSAQTSVPQIVHAFLFTPPSTTT